MKNNKQSTSVGNINWYFFGLPRNALSKYSHRGSRQNQIPESDEEKEDEDQGDHVSSWLSNKKNNSFCCK